MKMNCVLLISTVVLSGCVTKEVLRPYPVPACNLFSYITYDRLKDTTETIRGVKAHNATLEACLSHQAVIKEGEGKADER